MNKHIQIACIEEDEDKMGEVANILIRKGYDIYFLGNFDGDFPLLFVLNKEMSKEKAFELYPWLKEQFEHSSIPNLKILPFIVYESSKTSIDSLWDSGIGDNYEEIFSGEFKPYGWDLDDEKASEEFERIIEEYL